MTEDMDAICARENEEAAYLDAEAAARQRMLREDYESVRRSLIDTNNFIIDLASGKNCGFLCSEEQRQNLIAFNQKHAEELRANLRRYERCLRTGKYDFVEGAE